MHNQNVQKLTLSLICLALFSVYAGAWEHHTLITGPLISSWPEIADRDPVKVTSLEEFLSATEHSLEITLANEERWACLMLEAYAPLPVELAFKATGTISDIRKRFFEAIRINPNHKAALYLSSLVEDPEAPRTGLAPSEVSVVEGGAEMKQFRFEALNPGDLVHPSTILTTASHEPDYGLDIGLFTDNKTDYGSRYGFGEQPFGDPDLVYGSQAPFHMGFYHESWLVFLFAGYLKGTYPEYRIHLYKTLSQMAFDHGQEYWGWRFMGWGLHYLMDLSMPYHSTVLPGYSTVRMLLINLLSMLGYPKYVDNALQLVSNRHMAFERYQGIQLERLTRAEAWTNPLFEALHPSGTVPAYNDTIPRDEIARKSHDMSRKVNKALTTYMPDRFVNDPSFELAEAPDLNAIVDLVKTEHGQAAIDELNALLAEAFSIFSMHGRGYIISILPG